MTPPKLKATSAYRSVAVETRADQHDQYQLVLMMFDAVLESLARARGAIQQGDVAGRVQHITKAIRIVHEGLRTSLDLEKGGDLAANLADLYSYCVMRMTQANAKADAPALEEVAGLIKPIADAWREMRGGQPTPDANPTIEAPKAAAAPGKGVGGIMRSLSGMYGAAVANPGMALAGA